MSYTWTPDISLVEQLVPNRTAGLARTFTTGTTPSDTTVLALITQICDEVAAQAGNVDALNFQVTDTIKANDYAALLILASRTVAYGVATQIEVSYTSQEVKDGVGKASVLSTEYTKRLSGLRSAIKEFNAGQKLGGVNDYKRILGADSFPIHQDISIPPGYLSDPKGSGMLIKDPDWNPW